MMASGTPLSLRYHSDQLNRKISSTLRDFYNTGELCDVVLLVGSSKIRAHRVVLAAFSPYFRDMFHQPSSQKCVEISLRNHLTEEAVRQLIDFCYTSSITVDTESAERILAAANLLQVKEVEKLCITFLAAQQALKQEGGNSVFPPTHQYHLSAPACHTLSSPPDKSRADNSRELMCADTSGIGSNHTSPRQSSRPSSEQSGSGSVTAQPQEDPEGEIDLVQVKKEHEDSLSDQPYFSPYAIGNPLRPDFESLRTSMANLSGVFFTQGAPGMPLSCISPGQISSPSTQQLLMKALTQSQTSPLAAKDMSQLYGSLPGNQSSQSQDQSDEEPQSYSAPSEGIPLALSSQLQQCHICQQVFSSAASLKIHLADHREILSVPSSSPYKLVSPPKHYTSHTHGGTEGHHEEIDIKNMCGTCGKCFRDSQSLKFHRYNHVLRYQCNFCGKRFSRSWNLHRHRKTHFRQNNDLNLQAPITVIDVDSDRGDMEIESFQRENGEDLRHRDPDLIEEHEHAMQEERKRELNRDREMEREMETYSREEGEELGHREHLLMREHGRALTSNNDIEQTRERERHSERDLDRGSLSDSDRGKPTVE